MNVLRLDSSDNPASFANDQIPEDFNIALNRAIDPNVTIGFNRANNIRVSANHSFRFAIQGRGSRCLGLFAAEHWTSYIVPAGSKCAL
jgi:hypothetical protein